MKSGGEEEEEGWKTWRCFFLTRGGLSREQDRDLRSSGFSVSEASQCCR